MKINNAEGVRQFQPRVRALARTLGVALKKKRSTLKGLAVHMPNPFRVNLSCVLLEPRVVATLRSNHWAEISERLRRY
jgi:hypothetical protein